MGVPRSLAEILITMEVTGIGGGPAGGELLYRWRSVCSFARPVSSGPGTPLAEQ